MAIPSIRINGHVPRPLGSEANSTLEPDVDVAVSLASDVGISSISYSLIAPPGSTATLSNAAPTAPFSTTVQYVDIPGTYIVVAEANDDPDQTSQCAFTVLARNGLRVLAIGEETQWDRSYSYWKAWRDAIVRIKPAQIYNYPALDANHIHSWNMSESSGAFADSVGSYQMTPFGTYFQAASTPFAHVKGARWLVFSPGLGGATTDDGTPVDPTGGLTVEFSVFLPKATASPSSLVYIGSGGSGSHIKIDMNGSSAVRVNIAQAGVTFATSPAIALPIGRSVRIMMAYDWTAQTCILYMDGVAVTSINAGDGVPQLTNPLGAAAQVVQCGVSVKFSVGALRVSNIARSALYALQTDEAYGRL